MGMDPLDKEEEYEVTIVLQGPIKKKGFRDFQKELNTFLDNCANIKTGFKDGGGGDILALVRESRGGVRKTPKGP